MSIINECNDIFYIVIKDIDNSIYNVSLKSIILYDTYLIWDEFRWKTFKEYVLHNYKNILNIITYDDIDILFTLVPELLNINFSNSIIIYKYIKTVYHKNINNVSKIIMKYRFFLILPSEILLYLYPPTSKYELSNSQIPNSKIYKQKLYRIISINKNVFKTPRGLIVEFFSSDPDFLLDHNIVLSQNSAICHRPVDNSYVILYYIILYNERIKIPYIKGIKYLENGIMCKYNEDYYINDYIDIDDYKISFSKLELDPNMNYFINCDNHNGWYQYNNNSKFNKQDKYLKHNIYLQ